MQVFSNTNNVFTRFEVVRTNGSRIAVSFPRAGKTIAQAVQFCTQKFGQLHSVMPIQKDAQGFLVKIPHLATGLLYGIYLQTLAPKSQRERAHANARARKASGISLDRTQAAASKPTAAPQPMEPDPWELPTPPGPELAPPRGPQLKPLLLLPPANPVQEVTDPPELAGLNVIALRKLCTQQGVKWRNAHGKNKHLKKAEMIAALS